MNIRPIKTAADYQAALNEIENLFDAAPNSPRGDQLEVLATLVEAYEQQHYAIPAPDPIEAVLYYTESRGLTRKDLEPYLGQRARVSEILNRKRPLTLRMIQRLHSELGIPAEVLLTPYQLQSVKARKALPPNSPTRPTRASAERERVKRAIRPFVSNRDCHYMRLLSARLQGNTTFNFVGAVSPGAHSFTADPRFVDEAAGDYHLAPRQPRHRRRAVPRPAHRLRRPAPPHGRCPRHRRRRGGFSSLLAIDLAIAASGRYRAGCAIGAT